MEIIINSASNPRWANAAHTSINIDVNFEHLPEEIVAFSASANDTELHGRQIYENAVYGDYGTIQEYIPADPQSISFITATQFFIMAGATGLITQQEAIAAASSGAIPAAIEAIFSGLPTEAQFAARVRWARMTILERHEPLIQLAAGALGLSEAQVDDFFIEAATL